MKKNFKPSDELIRLAVLYFKAMAYTESIRPAIVKIQTDLLKEGGYLSKYDGKLIESPDVSYEMPENESKDYFNKLHHKYLEAGFHIKTFGNCPLLVAEELQRQARNLMIGQSAELNPDFPIDKLYSDMENLKQYTELLLRLLAPYVDEVIKKNGIKGDNL
jgi:hypothetical protein